MQTATGSGVRSFVCGESRWLILESQAGARRYGRDAVGGAVMEQNLTEPLAPLTSTILVVI